MAKRISFWLVIGLMVLVLSGAGWGAVTLDDVAKDIKQLQIGQAEIKMDIRRVDDKDNILLVLYGVFAAALAGMVWALINLSKEVRVPKEERVSKLEVFMEKVREHLQLIDEKLHLPRIALW